MKSAGIILLAGGAVALYLYSRQKAQAYQWKPFDYPTTNTNYQSNYSGVQSPQQQMTQNNSVSQYDPISALDQALYG
jgi:hypothetical protein